MEARLVFVCKSMVSKEIQHFLLLYCTGFIIQFYSCYPWEFARECSGRPMTWNTPKSYWITYFACCCCCSCCCCGCCSFEYDYIQILFKRDTYYIETVIIPVKLHSFQASTASWTRFAVWADERDCMNKSLSHAYKSLHNYCKSINCGVLSYFANVAKYLPSTFSFALITPIIAGAQAIIKVSSHQYRLLAGCYEMKIGHFWKCLAWWLSDGM